jgi:hypothetical protein
MAARPGQQPVSAAPRQWIRRATAQASPAPSSFFVAALVMALEVATCAAG